MQDYKIIKLNYQHQNNKIMNKNNSVLKHAQRLEREQQKKLVGGIGISAGKRCCEWDPSGKCLIYTCDRCQCP